MKRLFVLILLLAFFAIAEDVHDFSNLDAVRIPDGTAALPGLILQSEGESDPEGEQEGLYRSAEGEEGVGFTVNGVSVGKMLSTGWNGNSIGALSFPAGSDAAPSIYPTGDTNTGIYSAGTDTVNITTGGTLRLSLSTTLFSNTLPYSFPLGAAGTPSLYPGADSNTGIYSAGADTLNLTTGGTLRLSLTTTELTNTLPYVMPLGAAATPSIYPVGDSNTGLYSAGADELNLTTGGTLRLSLSTTALTSTLPILGPNGSAAAPTFGFSGDAGNGMYLSSGDTVDMVTAGALRTRFDANGQLNMGDFFAYPGNDGTAAVPQFAFGGPGAYYAGLFCNSSGNVGISRNGTELWQYAAATDTRATSAAEYAQTWTNYYAGAGHNTLTLRSTRGTSASPDYLDDNDVVGSLKFEGMDGTGTWGNGAEIRAQAIQDHASGKTGTELIFLATEKDSDTQTQVATMGMYRLLPGVLDLDLSVIDTRGVAPLSLSADWVFGYAGDIDAHLTGVSVVKWSTGHAGVMLDADGYIGFGNGATNAGADGSWRIGDNGAEGVSFEQKYDVEGEGEAWETVAHFDADTLVLDDTVWNDANVGALVLKTGGTLPGTVEWLDNDGDATGIYTLGFAVNEEGSGVIEIPHDYKEGTDITFHVHWGTNNAPSGTDYVQWQLTYTVAHVGDTLLDATTIAKEAAVDTQYQALRSDFTAITGTNFDIGDQFLFTIKRIAAVGDAFAGEALVHTIGIHYEADTIGSRTITTK